MRRAIATATAILAAYSYHGDDAAVDGWLSREGEVPEAEAPSEAAPEEGAEPEGEEAPRPPPADFNPISIPQGRREGGVRWEGVGTKYEHEEKE